METLSWKSGGCIEILYCVGREELLLDTVFIATAHRQYNYAGAGVCVYGAAISVVFLQLGNALLDR